MAAFAKGGGSERRGQAGWRLDSERFEPFLDITRVFGERCLHVALPAHIEKQTLFRSKCLTNKEL